MGSKPLTFEAVPLIEKKMDMTLDDIIKMTKKTVPHNGKKPQRQPNKNQPMMIDNVSKRNAKVQGFMDSRSFIRQGVLAQKRTSFRGNHFQAAKEVARKAAFMPNRNWVANSIKPRVSATTFKRKPTISSFDGKDNVSQKQRPQTMDALFADMKEQRVRMSQQTIHGSSRQPTQQRLQQQQRISSRPAPRNSLQQQQWVSSRPAPRNNGRRQNSYYY